MTEHITRRLVCDHCQCEARPDAPMLHLQTVVFGDQGYMGVPHGAVSLHACSLACAEALLPQFVACSCPIHKGPHRHAEKAAEAELGAPAHKRVDPAPKKRPKKSPR